MSPTFNVLKASGVCMYVCMYVCIHTSYLKYIRICWITKVVFYELMHVQFLAVSTMFYLRGSWSCSWSQASDVVGMAPSCSQSNLQRIQCLMCLSMVCPTWHIPGADIRERRGICSWNPPQGVSTQVRFVPIHSNCTYILFRCVKKMSLETPCKFHRYLISPCHTGYNRELWGNCKEYVGEWYTGLCPRHGG